MIEQIELDGLREIIQKQNNEIKRLKYIAWSMAETLDKNDIETEKVLELRKELESL